ncbi:hypothetical protein SUGI_0670590 [Cryptomeria japonica]|uniref:uncharacterized protein LOC131051885 n=1 Tax=Cryptomeria japonica TaxID=3369 RepID=UPI002414C937|nr:uncharacterized protein LOC131051885 [Cryptomeria japonica]GLJ33330.1 hypothetical protein SUGI_0670590 [Cryptomeria japonica]
MESLPVTLRNFEESDVDDFMEWATDEEVYRFSKHLPYKSREQAENYLKNEAMVHPWLKAICLNGRAVGSISLRRGCDDCWCKAGIGYRLARRWWGEGLTTQAVKLALSTAFIDMPGLERIEGIVEPENVGSQRVFEKAGFVKEGLLCKYLRFKGKTRDFYSYSFLAPDLPNCV